MFSALRLHNLKISRFALSIRQSSKYKTKMYETAALLDDDEPINEFIKKVAPRLIYNSVIEFKIVKYETTFRNKIKEKPEAPLIPLTLKYLTDEINVTEDIINENVVNTIDKTVVNFPYDTTKHSVEETDAFIVQETKKHAVDIASEASAEVQKRYEMQKEFKNWMASYDSYDDKCLEEDADGETWRINYGTPDRTSSISDVPCGGCGAFLHCKDTAIPGYIPSEIFHNAFLEGGSNLQAITCQRCHFLKSYNIALQVQVTPDDYPKVLTTISKQGGLVILMVDLLDFPCSIWPGIGEIFGRDVPIVVVGNKVDLLPQDSRNFLTNVKDTLTESVKLAGFATFNIKHVALISARTGYGIEDLITRLNSLHRLDGHVYIVGCTNVGKSSLFNAFLQSDFCKTQALDLIQRATTSVWPGTTLNLLKFPIKRPMGYRQFLRFKRMTLVKQIESEERVFRRQQLKATKDPKFASLIGHIDVTHNPETERKEDTTRDLFNVGGRLLSGITQMGINENSKDFKHSKWCYDTPGVVQPDQIIHLLTTDELLLTLPKDIIIPRSFCIKPSSSLFIAGLARLDFIEGPESVRLTVFASKELPITVCAIEDADELYQELLGSELLKVPIGDAERISKWPKLQMAKRFSVTGINRKRSTNDVVLSSAGWIAIAGREGLHYKFQAWTPQKRGVYIRECLLPHAVALAGKRIKTSVAYHKYRFYVNDFPN